MFLSRLIGAIYPAGIGLISWYIWQRGFIPDIAFYGLAVAALISGLFILYDTLYLEVFWEVLSSLFPLLLLAGGAIAAVILVFGSTVPIDTAGTPAPKPKSVVPVESIVIAIGVASGWIATGFASEYRRRSERRLGERDVLLALRSEISAAVQTLDGENWNDQSRKVKRAITKGTNRGAGAYFPFTLTETPPHIFEALSDRIELLSENTVVSVVEFYAAFSDLTVLAKDMQRPDLVDLPKTRRVALHQRLTNTRKKALQRGLQAIYDINVYLGDPDPGGRKSLPRTDNNLDIEVDR